MCETDPVRYTQAHNEAEIDRLAKSIVTTTTSTSAPIGQVQAANPAGAERKPEELLAAILRDDLGADIHPTTLRLFLRARWGRVATLAHRIHGTDTTEDQVAVARANGYESGLKAGDRHAENTRLAAEKRHHVEVNAAYNRGVTEGENKAMVRYGGHRPVCFDHVGRPYHPASYRSVPGGW